MFPQIQHGQKSVRIAFLPLTLHRRAQQRLREDQVGEGGEVEEGVVGVEELAEEGFEAGEVGCGGGVEVFEVDVEEGGGLVLLRVLLLLWWWFFGVRVEGWRWLTSSSLSLSSSSTSILVLDGVWPSWVAFLLPIVDSGVTCS